MTILQSRRTKIAKSLSEPPKSKFSVGWSRTILAGATGLEPAASSVTGMTCCTG